MALEIEEQYVPQENSFFRNHFHHMIIAMMVLIVLLIIVVCVVLYQITHRPLPQFSAVGPDGRRMILTAFDEPNLLPDTILQWASKAATVAYTFDFVAADQEVQAARPFFTTDGWQDYLNSVRGVISRIVQNQLFVNSVVSGTPVISNQGPLPGRGYVWRVQIPFLVTYQSGNTVYTQNYLVVLSIIRVPTSMNPQGIGIDQFVMR